MTSLIGTTQDGYTQREGTTNLSSQTIQKHIHMNIPSIEKM